MGTFAQNMSTKLINWANLYDINLDVSIIGLLRNWLISYSVSHPYFTPIGTDGKFIFLYIVSC